LRIGFQRIVTAITDDRYLLCELEHYPRNRSLFNLDLFHAVWKERFDELPAQNSFATTASAGQSSVLQTRTRERSQYFSWRLLSRLYALEVIGLAIAVLLSAFGHKLSLYDRRAASSSRILVVKLWSESRKALVTTTDRLRAKVSRLLGSYALPPSIQRFPRLGHTVAWFFPVSRRGTAYFDFLIPFRSPPLDRFCRI
jgi:hypothetical protein